MKKQIFSYLFILCASVVCRAQVNLVPNPSFEDYNDCPDNEGQFYKVYDWIRLRQSPDYINACDTTNTTGVPHNIMGHQNPASGNAYAGILSYSTGTGGGLREYFGCELISPLLNNVKYYVTLKTSLGFSQHPQAGNRYSSNKMGVLFTTTKYDADVGNVLSIQDFAHVYTDSIISDTSAWFTIRGSFIADSAYRYMAIGNFFADSLTNGLLINPAANWDFSYYYIDDVCVSTDSVICETIFTGNSNTSIPGNKLSLFPNPCSTSLQIQSPGTNSTDGKIIIFDALGRRVFEDDLLITSKFFSISVQDLPDGFYTVAFLNGKIKLKGNFIKSTIY